MDFKNIHSVYTITVRRHGIEECSINLREAIVLLDCSHTRSIWCIGAATKSPHFSLLPHAYVRKTSRAIPRWHARRYFTAIFPAREERQSALFLCLRSYVRPARRWVLPLTRSKPSTRQVRTLPWATIKADGRRCWSSTASSGIATLETSWSRALLYERGLLLFRRASKARTKCSTWWQ